MLKSDLLAVLPCIMGIDKYQYSDDFDKCFKVFGEQGYESCNDFEYKKGEVGQ